MTSDTRPSAESIAREFLARLLEEDGPSPAVDWERYRIMQLIPGSAGAGDAAARDALVGRGFVELGRGTFDAETERRSLQSLRTLVRQILGVQPVIVAGFVNPLRSAMTSPPAATTPPNLFRLLTAVGEIVGSAEAVTVASSQDTLGERLMTLLFVAGRYVGFLPASRALPASGARA